MPAPAAQSSTDRSSTTTRWRPGEPTTLRRMVFEPLVAKLHVNTASLDRLDRAYRSTVATTFPSTITRARPFLGPRSETHATRRPVNRSEAVAPTSVETR